MSKKTTEHRRRCTLRYSVEVVDDRIQYGGTAAGEVKLGPGWSKSGNTKIEFFDDTMLPRKPLDELPSLAFSRLLLQKTLPHKLQTSLSYVSYENGKDPGYALALLDTIAPKDEAISSSSFHVPGIFKILPPKQTVWHSLSQWKDKDLSIPHWLACAALASHELTIFPNRENSGQFEVTHDITFHRWGLGEYCGALPMAWDREKLPDQCVAVLRMGDKISPEPKKASPPVPRHISPHLESALIKGLSSVLRQSGRKIVFLKGDPGSGKDVFLQAINRSVQVKSPESKVETLGVGGMSLDDIRKFLFGFRAAGSGQTEKGAISKCVGGVMALDEFDKAGRNETERKAFYASLLRVIESEECFPEGSSEKQIVKDVSWILAVPFPNLEQRACRMIYGPDLPIN